MSLSQTKRPILIGEILFDCFANQRVLGGAPLNVAWNLRGLGCHPAFLSAVGNDADGTEAISTISKWGIDPSAIQIAEGHPTGVVEVNITDGDPQYEIHKDVAYDFIDLPGGNDFEDAAAIFYHGSLAFRSETSRRTILRLINELSCPRFVDLNIRHPHFDFDWLDDLIGGADHLKINAGELRSVAEHTGMDPVPVQGASDEAAIRDQVAHVRERYQIGDFWITLGDQGAIHASHQGQWVSDRGQQTSNVIDTVGAGDAFAAVVIEGLIKGAEPSETLARANRFAAKVCGIRGATTDDPDFYQHGDLK